MYSKVILCANENQTEKKVLKALAHELVHMFDSCRAGFNLESIEDLACSEIRAANLIHCQPVHWSLADPVTRQRKNPDTAVSEQKNDKWANCPFKECIKRTATHSVRLITGVDDVLAREAVEKAYVRCYADFEPFCKHFSDRYSFST
ncbi:hypothetical protein M514_06689 [Trichuris suis]|uniref:Mitochondrial inner membrane protease ATP23 n=1 Tax=Trichuris suis TaxID=68888 RepID=A0A085NHM7_9BILA|nr:hypothetical protein M514_06689 [Trichuris suis]